MFFTKENLIKILRENLNYQLVDDKIFGRVIKLDARTAYRFCLTTNTYYLNDIYGLRLFGRFVTYNHRDLSLNQGLFLINPRIQELSESQPLRLSEQYPFIYSGSKKLIFIESQKTYEVISGVFKRITMLGEKPEDYIINLIHEDGSQWEHYFEFMASELFIRKGYFTDIQLPWSYHGRPDFGIYKHPLIDILKSMSLITHGSLILELSALKLFKKNSLSLNNFQNNGNGNYSEFIVGEVKTTQTKSQILEYLKTGLPFKGYEFIPNKKKRETFCGLITFDKNNKIQIQESPENVYIDLAKIQKDYEWFNYYIKIHLLGNLCLSEIKYLMAKQINSDILSFQNLIKLIKKVKVSNILKVIKNGL